MAWTKSKEEIEILRETGKLHARILSDLAQMVKPGVTTKQLDEYAEKEVRDAGDEPAFLHYRPEGMSIPYPASLCVSVNDEIVHGIPTKDNVLKDGDLVSLDLGIKHQGLITDAAITVPVGKVSKELRTLIDVTQGALMAGIDVAQVGNTIGDIGFAISDYVRPHKYGVIRELGGHGVGHEVHEEPFIANFGKKGTGYDLEVGMVFALEPMFTLGKPHISLLGDGYTIVSQDHSWSAHFEHTIAITEDGPVILTEK
ncbi:MAG: type I methionyl aminopeptidase [Candidatus Pacebacteria bacterium]|nr:type I methionyl aminopeptidase [Candidatus Paceibacterota bacterium]